MTYSLVDVKKKVEEFDSIWKCRIISGCFHLDINNIRRGEINFRTITAQSSIISGISIKSKLNQPEFSFYAKDINPEKIEIGEGLITIHFKSEGVIKFFCNPPS
ncbi:hypothetical protein MKZ07_23220 [Paenibacillus sp. FSL P4-0338]|uniref:hypothetical protein n=1 Tax=Paenibacillus sp. FSL P4-0338 TaxID=2921635 RepID=UPI0030FC6E2A